MKECIYLEAYYNAKQVSSTYKSNQVNGFKQFLQYCEELNIRARKLTPVQANDYMSHLKTQLSILGLPYSNSRINELLHAVKQYYTIKVQQGEIKSNPFNSIRKLSIDKISNSYGANVLSTDEVKQLFEATEDMREKAILHLFYSAGLRRTEAQEIKITDIDFHKCDIIVRRGKGGKSRIVPISDKVMQEIKEYIMTQREELLNGKDSAYLVVSRLSTQTRGGTMYNQLLKITERTAITKRVTPHVLRASLATHLLANGIYPEVVQTILGHSVLDTTTLYTHTHKI